MLNKLRYFKTIEEADSLEEQKALAKKCFFEHVRQEGKDISLIDIDGGTLGITFRCDGLRKAPVFVKTHLLKDVYRKSLEKEYHILKYMYDGDIFCEKFVAQEGDSHSFLFVLMEYLSPGPGLSFRDIREIIHSYDHLEMPCCAKGIDLYDIAELLTGAYDSLYELEEKGFYSPDLVGKAEMLLGHLGKYLGDADRILCHGDLADKNIMVNQKGAQVVLDWEDAFWGIKGYDYLYWLTFFSHRKYYNIPGVFTVPGLDAEIVAGILTLIILIKNAISFYSKEYIRHRLSMNDRLEEIYRCMRSEI